MADKIKVVVTGGAGFIGSHLSEALLGKGYEVVIIDDLATGRRENIASFVDKITFVEGSILDRELLKKTFEGVKYVFHQAALPSVPKSLQEPYETHKANAEGTLNVFLAARDAGVQRVVYASSSSVYGDSPTLPKVETMPYNPLSPYAAHKLYGELMAKMAANYFNVETVGLRYFNVFGPRQNPNSKYAAVIPLFIKLMAAGEAPTINGDGTITRDFTYIANVVQANICAALAPNEASGQVFNIACGDSISLNDLVMKINTELKTSITPMYKDVRAGDILHSLADIGKARKILGYNPEVSFDEGLRNTIASLLK